MREILFRGKRIDNGEWCIGFYCQMADESDGGARVKHAIVVPTFMVQMGFLVYEVGHETVGQYTGLTDKNGKKIFEGDIISDGGFVGIVVFDDKDDGAFLVKDPADPADGEFFSSLIDREVCGNIHDNPDLLDVEE